MKNFIVHQSARNWHLSEFCMQIIGGGGGLMAG